MLSVDPVFQSVGYAVNSTVWWVDRRTTTAQSFEYDQEMVSAGHPSGLALLLGISDDRVKVGVQIIVNISGVVWEADNQSSRFVEDTYGDGTLLLAISPDHSRLVGTTTEVLGSGSTEYLTWWTYAGDATLVEDAAGNPIDGRFTSGTNADVGYLVGQAGEAASGDLLHIESTNQTVPVVDWFESLSGQDLPAETSEWGPEITYDSASGQVAIISGGYLFIAKIYDVEATCGAGRRVHDARERAAGCGRSGCVGQRHRQLGHAACRVGERAGRMARSTSTTTAASPTLRRPASTARMPLPTKPTTGTTTAMS